MSSKSGKTSSNIVGRNTYLVIDTEIKEADPPVIQIPPFLPLRLRLTATRLPVRLRLTSAATETETDTTTGPLENETDGSSSSPATEGLRLTQPRPHQ